MQTIDWIIFAAFFILLMGTGVWALTIFVGLFIGSWIFPPAWVRLRKKYNIQSPTEYLAKRYNLPTQQIIALNASHFGGVLGLIISWFGALMGPVAVPMLLGVIPFFRRMDHRAALTAIGSGFLTFVLVKYLFEVPIAAEIGSPVMVSFILYCVIGLIMPKPRTND